jgi:hypothetical protein
MAAADISGLRGPLNMALAIDRAQLGKRSLRFLEQVERIDWRTWDELSACDRDPE